MTPAERAKLLRDSADAIERVDANGGKVPEGYRLEWFYDDAQQWIPTTNTSGYRIHRLVELPKQKPTYKPHSRETWPDWRYLKSYSNRVGMFGPITDEGVLVMFADPSCNTLYKWRELVSQQVSNSSNGPWEIAGVKE